MSYIGDEKTFGSIKLLCFSTGGYIHVIAGNLPLILIAFHVFTKSEKCYNIMNI